MCLCGVPEINKGRGAHGLTPPRREAPCLGRVIGEANGGKELIDVLQ